MNLLPLTLAEAAPAQQSPFGMMGMMAIVFAIMYFMLIRPQKRREKERKAMISAVKSGSRVLLTSGIMGHITTVKDQTLIVRIADNVKVEVVKTAISQVLEKDETPSEIESTN